MEVRMILMIVVIGLLELAYEAYKIFRSDSSKAITSSLIITNNEEIDRMVIKLNQRDEITARGLNQKIYGLTDYEKKYIPN